MYLALTLLGSMGSSMPRRKLYRKRTAVGAPPGTLAVDPSSNVIKVDFFKYDSNGITEKHAANIAELGEAIRGDSVVWILDYNHGRCGLIINAVNQTEYGISCSYSRCRNSNK